ncbi:outer membrane lipoprotein LolB [Nitrosospira sp. Nsp14]|uniref:lipoprotein insertase outer membrane protein LolB n=1 Tax=Nitrosospira sp. Nsp14 TaxID=1855333 RepID=UPI0008DF496A|nr:lipoprotein insertase outer membrane protein LolB [Nitrosospira sp. Nsp14]SFH48040.1 outer membrane lipoprotein LolB [Nitrosospira sp. Nsp14]
MMDYAERLEPFRSVSQACLPSKYRFIAVCWSCVLVLPNFIAGCATLAPPTLEETVVSTIIAEPVADIAHARSADFALVGRASVKGGKENFSGGVQWQHSGNRDEILLLNPLGQTLAQIRRMPEGVHLATYEQENYYASDVESLTEQVLGWRLPLMGLQYWVQGLHSPVTVAEIDKNPDGRVLAIRQDGWEIGYASYFPASPAQDLQGQGVRPKLLMLSRRGLQIKLVIDAWGPRDD